MKKLRLLLFICASTGSASAALYTLQTGTGADINGFANAAGSAFQTASTTGLPPGSAEFGYFTISDAAVMAASSPASLLAAFVVFGGPTQFAVAGPIGQKGSVSVAGSQVVTGSGFSGKNIYFLVANNALPASATQFAVLKTTFLFDPAQDAIPTPNVLVPTPANSTILIGSSIADLKTTTTDATVNPGFRTAVVGVPEPSAALLGAIGALGLLRRRRN